MSSKDVADGLTIGFIIGAAVGLAVGFFYAPQAGVETRRLISEQAEQTRERAAGIVDKAEGMVGEARKQV